MNDEQKGQYRRYEKGGERTGAERGRIRQEQWRLLDDNKDQLGLDALGVVVF